MPMGPQPLVTVPCLSATGTRWLKTPNKIFHRDTWTEIHSRIQSVKELARALPEET